MIGQSVMPGEGVGYSEQGDGEMDLRVLIDRLLARKWWIVASVVIFSAAAYAAAHLLTPIYRATTILIPAKAGREMGGEAGGLGAGGLGGVASLVGVNLGGNDSLTEEALAVLKSRQFTEKFVHDLNLTPILFAYLWDAKAGKWTVDESKQPTPSRAFHYFDGIRSIVPEKKSSLVALNVDWTDRFAAATWANELVARLNLEMREREMKRADAAVGYLEKEFESTSAVATREAIGRLIENQVKQRMLASVTPEYAFRVIDPAVPPDKNEIHFPRKFLMEAAGPIVGLIFGVLGVLGYAALKSVPPRRSAIP